AEKTRLQYDPTTQSQIELAKSALGQDQLMYQQAAARGDTAGMNAARIKYLQDMKLVDINQRTGAITTLGGLSPGDVGYGFTDPSNGTGYSNGQVNVLPGAPAA